MTETPRPAEPPDFLDALRAIDEALALPFPATSGDEGMYRLLLEDRARDVRVALASILGSAEHEYPSRAERVAWSVKYLRGRLVETPPTGYVHGPPIYGKDEDGRMTVASGCKCEHCQRGEGQS